MTDRVLYSMEDIPEDVRNCALSIGDFDGVHLGHQRILQLTRQLADAAGIGVVAMTFDPPPERILHPDAPLERLTPFDVKCDLLLSAGADWVLTVKDDRELMSMPPEKFIRQLLVEKLAPQYVVEGPDFLFGSNRRGNAATLRQYGDMLGFVTRIVECVSIDLPEGPQRVSSTLVRSLVRQGRVAEARDCMGRHFALYSTVITGAGHGKKLRFPTVNIGAGEQVCPADGIYAGKARLGETEFPAAISIGHKSTLGPVRQKAIEAFLIDAVGDFYGQSIRLSFHERLRQQEKFDSIEALKKQIAKDVERVREYFR